jgi:hypothetical protein
MVYLIFNFYKKLHYFYAFKIKTLKDFDFNFFTIYKNANFNNYLLHFQLADHIRFVTFVGVQNRKFFGSHI